MKLLLQGQAVDARSGPPGGAATRTLQTVWGAALPPRPRPRSRRERVATAGRRLRRPRLAATARAAAPLAPGPPRARRLVALALRRRARCAWRRARGWRGVVMNFRSCSGELNRQPRFYHSGETGDLDAVVDRARGAGARRADRRRRRLARRQRAAQVARRTRSRRARAQLARRRRRSRCRSISPRCARPLDRGLRRLDLHRQLPAHDAAQGAREGPRAIRASSTSRRPGARAHLRRVRPRGDGAAQRVRRRAWTTGAARAAVPISPRIRRPDLARSTRSTIRSSPRERFPDPRRLPPQVRAEFVPRGGHAGFLEGAGRGGRPRGPSAGRSISSAGASSTASRSASVAAMRDRRVRPARHHAVRRRALDAYDRAVARAPRLGRRRASTCSTARCALDPGLAARPRRRRRLPLPRRALRRGARRRRSAARAAAAGADARASAATSRPWPSSSRAGPTQAERAMREHLAGYPRDLAVFQRLYFIWFWQGRFPEMLALDRRPRPLLSGQLLHARAARVRPRGGRPLRRGRPHGRRGRLTRIRATRGSIHALAHALYEMAAFDTGVAAASAWPSSRARTSAGSATISLWHLALMHLRDEASTSGPSDVGRERLRAARRRRSRAICTTRSRSCGGSSSLGRDVGERWKPFAAIAGERLDRQGLLFHAAHLAMALAAGGDWATAERQLDDAARARRAQGPDRAGRRRPGPADRRASTPSPDGDYRRAIERIEPLRPRIVELGGSRAQRDVFHDTLLEATFRAGDMERAERLLAARVARRPDRFWKTRAAAGAARS